MNPDFFPLSYFQKPPKAQTIVPAAAALLWSVVIGLLSRLVSLFIYLFLTSLLAQVFEIPDQLIS